MGGLGTRLRIERFLLGIAIIDHSRVSGMDLFPLRQFPLCQLTVTKSELTNQELTNWEVERVGRFSI